MKFQKRDWVIVVLALAVIGTNWFWYQNSKGQELSNSSSASYDVHLQSQINKLKACLDNDTRPCDISPSQ